MKNHFVDVLPPNHYNLFIDFMIWFQMCTCCHSNFSCDESGLNIISVCFSLCRSFVIDLKVKLVLTNIYLKNLVTTKFMKSPISITFCTLLVISVLNYMYF